MTARHIAASFDPARAGPAAPGPAAIPGAEEIAVAIVIADIVHELRRAAAAPIWRSHRGKVASSHIAAVAFGWLEPAPALRGLLRLTRSGRRALAAAAAP